MADHRKTDRAILRHLALYCVGIKHLLGDLTEKGDANNSLARQRASGLVDYFTPNMGREHLLPHGISWATPTAKGCIEMGVPVERAANPPGPALDAKIALVWHCMTTGAVKLETHQVENLTGWKSPTNVAFALDSTSFLWRVYFGASDERTIASTALKIADDLIDRIPHFSKRLGVLILAPSKQKCATLKTAIKNPPLPIDVRLGPSADSLHEYLEERRAKRGNSNGG